MPLASDMQANEKMDKDVCPNVMMRNEDVARNKGSRKDQMREIKHETCIHYIEEKIELP